MTGDERYVVPQQVGASDAEAHLSVILESLHDGIVVQDADGVIVQSNAAAHRILGLSADEMSGRTSLDPLWRAIHEDGSPFPGDEHPAMVTLATGEPVRGGVMGVRKRDGSLTWIVINTALLPGSGGRQVVASFTDVTEMRAVQQDYRLLAENASDLVYRLDTAGVIEWVSPNVTALLGWSADDWVGHNRAEFTHPDDIPADPQTAGQVGVAGRRGGRVRLRAKGGGYRWLDMSLTDVCDTAGRVVGEVGSARDIDEAMQVEEELAQSSAQLRLVLDNSADVVAHLGADGTVLWISPSVQRAYGWDPQEITGTRFRLAAPESAAQMDAVFANAVATGLNVFHARLRVRCADGSTRWADTRNTLVWDPAGGLSEMVVGLRDAEEAVGFERELADRERRLRLMLEGATDVVFDIATDNTYRWVSPSVREVLGWAPEDLVGKSGVDLIHPEDFAGVVQAREHPDEGVAGVDTLRLRTSDGGYRWMSGTSREIRDGEVLLGRVVGLRDVDDQVRDRQALAESEARYRLLAEKRHGCGRLGRPGWADRLRVTVGHGLVGLVAAGDGRTCRE